MDMLQQLHHKPAMRSRAIPHNKGIQPRRARGQLALPHYTTRHAILINIPRRRRSPRLRNGLRRVGRVGAHPRLGRRLLHPQGPRRQPRVPERQDVALQHALLGRLVARHAGRHAQEQVPARAGGCAESPLAVYWAADYCHWPCGQW